MPLGVVEFVGPCLQATGEDFRSISSRMECCQIMANQGYFPKVMDAAVFALIVLPRYLTHSEGQASVQVIKMAPPVASPAVAPPPTGPSEAAPVQAPTDETGEGAVALFHCLIIFSSTMSSMEVLQPFQKG